MLAATVVIAKSGKKVGVYRLYRLFGRKSAGNAPGGWWQSAAPRRAAAPSVDAQRAASAQPKLRKKKLAKPYRYRPGNPSRRIARL
ncbi:MAG TPA: hypothetical protein VMV69_04925 [Pirellulales bacterium]|nr:hypothetical protein [Pirellulales bacterium]